MASRCTTTAEDGPRWPKFARDRRKMGQDGPQKGRQKGPQSGPKLSREGHSQLIVLAPAILLLQDALRWRMLILRSFEIASRCPEIAQDKLKMISKGHLNGPWMASAGTKSSVKHILKCTSPQDGVKMHYYGRRWPKMAQDGRR